MGESKRRKQNDPNYGKLPLFVERDFFYIGEVAKPMYDLHGKGMFIYVTGQPLRYATSSFGFFVQGDKDALSLYDPNTEFVISVSMVEDKEVNVPYMTMIEKNDCRKRLANMRVGKRKEWTIDDVISSCLILN